MIDFRKRKTLKKIAVAFASFATGGAVTAAPLALDSNGVLPIAVDDVEGKELAQIEVATRLSVEKNDLEVVIKNIGSQPVTITHLTPAVVKVARGEFDFSALLDDGPLHLQAGKVVVVPIQQKAVNTTAASATLADVLKTSMSVVTDADSFASVSIVRRGAVTA